MNRIYPFFVAMFWVWNVSAQNFVMSNAPITTCSGTFRDPGDNANYAPNLNLQTLICPSTPNVRARIVFQSFSLASGDTLWIYDGATVDAPILLTASMNTSIVASIISSIQNATGCLLVRFKSDATSQAAGWQANLTCFSCQEIIPTLFAAVPSVTPEDTSYINVCLGSDLILVGGALFPENGQYYNQSALSCSYNWLFNDGTNATTKSVTHLYQNPGIYSISLKVTDTLGCATTDTVFKKVRVLPAPTFAIGTLDTLCVGDTVQVNAGTGPLSDNQVVSILQNPAETFPQTSSFGVLPIPDGIGQSFSSIITVSGYPTDAVIESISDIEAICVNMEHSWMHDLQISIICPNDSSVIMHNVTVPNGTGTAGETFLGIPNDPDNPAAPNAINTPFGWVEPGQGFDYHWSPTSTIGTFREYADANNQQTLPSGAYETFEPLSKLIGCPVNGDWELRINDNWGIDNGVVFYWYINFANIPLDSTLQESYSTTLNTSSWENFGASVLTQGNNSITAVIQNMGNTNFVLEATNSAGCTSDTTFTFQVLPAQHPNCGSCQNIIQPLPQGPICFNTAPVELNASPVNGGNLNLTFHSYPNYTIGFENHPYTAPYETPIQVNYNTNSLSVGAISAVCVDFATDHLTDVRLFLKTPIGALFELSTNNGGVGNNYTNTCFTPTATTSITQGTAPFTGNYLPESNWSVINGQPSNGIWKLVVSDGAGLDTFGILQHWSISFNSTNNVNYTWLPSAGLSCANCPNPTAAPTQPITYIVNATDNFGCTQADTIKFIGENVGIFDACDGLDSDCNGLIDDDPYSCSFNTAAQPYVATNITTNTAKLRWGGRPCHTAYRVQYRKGSVQAWANINLNTPINTKTLTQLTANTFYKWRVRSTCANGQQLWSPTKSFVTAVASDTLFSVPAGDPVSIKLSPNPAHAQVLLSIELPESQPNTEEVILTDAFGRIIQTWVVTSRRFSETVQTSNLPAGVYFVTLRSPNNLPETKTLLIE